MLAPTSDLFILWSGALTLSLTGGFHCAGMCGGIAALNVSKKTIFLYQMGRLVSYLFLGLGSGYLGHKFYVQIKESGTYLNAIVILLLGAFILFYGQAGSSLSKKVWNLLPKNSGIKKHFLLGIANGLLPCHFLYGFLTMAAASGKPGVGALILLALWLGSSTYLFSFSYLSKKLEEKGLHNKKLLKVIHITLFIALLFNLIGHHIHQ